MDNSIENALAAVIRDLGTAVVDDSARLRGALIDQLGSEAHRLRDGVSAIVLACDAGVVSKLASGSEGSEELSAELSDLGLNPDLARSVIAAWTTVIGSHPVHRPDGIGPVATQLPPETPPLTVTGSESIADRTGSLLSSSSLPHVAPEAKEGFRKKRVLVAALALVLIGTFGATALALTSSGEKKRVETAGTERTSSSKRSNTSETTSSTSSTSTTTTTSTTTAVPVVPQDSAPVAPVPESPNGGPGSTTTAKPRTSPAPVAPTVTTAVPKTTTPTVAPTPAPTTPTTAPAAALVAVNDRWEYTLQYFDGSPGIASLTVLANDSGPYNWVDFMSNPTHGAIAMNSTTGAIEYTPHHNGSFTDTFTYRLRNTNTGAISNTATVTVTVWCNTGWTCYAG